ncbi:MAG TPA: PQQ-dependent sugar dehydrogenase [Solirubrobacterales bacterium]|nr:PQQ-dependent sugar dehydrogenase [Solirubrobacterales bacterium]
MDAPISHAASHGSRALAAVFAVRALCAADADAQAVQATQFGGQAYALPFHVAGAPGDLGQVFVAEAPGTIRLVEDGVTQAAPFLDISADVHDLNEEGCECGLLSVALSPDYAQSGLLYVFYTRDDPAPGSHHHLRIEEFSSARRRSCRWSSARARRSACAGPSRPAAARGRRCA